MANKLFQAFIDTAKTIAGYPITVANAVFMRDGSTLDEFSENIPHREDNEDTDIEVPNIDADMLNGHPADYYAKQSDLSVLNTSVTQVNNKIGNTDVSKWGNSLTAAIKSACDKADANENAIANVNSNFNNFGNWNPTIEHGTITGSSCQYYKIGKLVTLFCAIWGGGDGTDNVVTLSLPFPSISIRAYGSVGFFPGAVNYPNLHVIIAEGGNLIFEYSGGDNIKHINGKQWGTCQFSITYLSN